MKAGALALLTTAQMYAADRAAIAAGLSGIELMEAAGRAVAEAIRRRWSLRHVLVLAGPGNNGGDGYVAARLLAEACWPVTVAALTPPETLKGDASAMAARWTGPVIDVGDIGWDEVGLVIDALFGAGLSKPVEGAAREALQAAESRGLPIVAIDVPSGISGDSGAVLGYAPQVALTVSFFRAKPGHLLLPGRDLCGPVEIAPIGIPDRVLDEIAPACWRNGPALWLDSLPVPRGETHKYHRGHALILGGPMTGAGRLAAQAARRIGAGLVSLAVPPGTAAIYASDHPGAIVQECADRAALTDILRDPRRNALLAGPGAGTGPELRDIVAAVLAAGRPTVLDADAISTFSGDSETLAGLVHGPCVLTPHEGEFARLFPDVKGDRLSRAREAARRLGAVLVLKGSDTVIVAPDGKAVINNNAPADLATAGSGDVLAGLVLGLLAQRMPVFEAACAAVWLHGAAAGSGTGSDTGSEAAGLIAEDIPDRLPGLLRRLRRNRMAGF